MAIQLSKVNELAAKSVFNPVNISWKRIGTLINYLMLPLLVVIIWETIVRLKLVSPVLMPPLQQVGATFVNLLKTGQLAADLGVSLGRLIKGYGLGVLAGITFGTLMGISVKLNRFFSITFDAIRQVPPMAWIPLVILWFGIGELSKVVLIFKAAFFPILLNTISGVVNTPKSLLEVAKIHRVGKRSLIFKVYAPAALPAVLVGLRLGLGASWMTMVAAELIAASSGIGYLINDGRELSQPDLVLVGMVVIGSMGVIMDTLLKKIAGYCIKW